jgi:predicted protein tyrosine phosphatase
VAALVRLLIWTRRAVVVRSLRRPPRRKQPVAIEVPEVTTVRDRKRRRASYIRRVRRYEAHTTAVAPFVDRYLDEPLTSEGYRQARLLDRAIHGRLPLGETRMFAIKVAGRDEAKILIAQDWPTRIVSLTNDEGERHGPHHLHIHVNDLEDIIEKELYPTPAHLQSVLAFTSELTEDDRILVHCFGGHRRSTAVAIGILVQHGMDFERAFAHVEAIRDGFMPNQLFIKYIDEHFGLQSRLIQLATGHRLARNTNAAATAPMRCSAR